MSSIGRFGLMHEMTPESYLNVGEVMVQPYNKTVESLIKGTWVNQSCDITTGFFPQTNKQKKKRLFGAYNLP